MATGSRFYEQDSITLHTSEALVEITEEEEKRFREFMSQSVCEDLSIGNNVRFTERSIFIMMTLFLREKTHEA